MPAIPERGGVTPYRPCGRLPRPRSGRDRPSGAVTASQGRSASRAELRQLRRIQDRLDERADYLEKNKEEGEASGSEPD